MPSGKAAGPPLRPREKLICAHPPPQITWRLIFRVGVKKGPANPISVNVSGESGGTRDQPRRMGALGHAVWTVRWITFIYSAFWGAVSGLLFVYYNKYIHPASLSITSSAEALLGVIAGGSGTLAGPVVGAAIIVLLKNYVSGFIERWNMLMGFVFVLIVIFMPEGVVPGVRRLLARLRRKTG